MLHDAAKVSAHETGGGTTTANTGDAAADVEQAQNSASSPEASQEQHDSQGTPDQIVDSGDKAGKHGKQEAEQWNVQFDFSHHPYYPVLRLKHAAAPKK